MSKQNHFYTAHHKDFLLLWIFLVTRQDLSELIQSWEQFFGNFFDEVVASGGRQAMNKQS